MKILNLKYQPLAKVFRHFFAGIFLLAIAISAQAQSKVVSGFVHDQNKVGLYGVTVAVKGTKTATSTDFDGKFKIEASANDQLVFSYIGFETRTLSVGSSQTLNVSLTEATSKLNEVVVVGYGTQKKANLTGSVSTVSAKQIENRPVTNVANALQGAVPGMNVTRTNGQPGNEGLAIQIRGASSANGNVNPLLVVDGVTTDLNVLQSINPNDVETISVLKDGSAAAIYGAQAAGGVILVTTKKGKQGKTIFEYNTQVAIQNPLIVPQRVTLMEEAIYANAAYTAAGSPAYYSAFDLANIQNNIPYVQDPNNPNSYLYYNQEDISKKVIGKNDVITTHNLSARGGTDKYNYLFSLGYLDQKGMMLVGPDHYKRLNLRLNVGTELNKYLFLDSKVAYTKSETNRAAGNSINNLGNEYGNGNNGLLYWISKIRMRVPIYTPEGRYNGIGTRNDSYVLLKEGGYNNQYVDDMDANFQLTIKDVVKGLKFRTIYGHKQKTSETNAFFRTIELWNKTAVSTIINNPNAYAVIPATLATNNFQFLADYNLTLGEDHHFTALAGYQWEDFRNSQVDSRAFTLKSNDFPSLNIGEATTKQNSQVIQTSAMQSLFGRVTYNFKDKYLADFTIRTDENSRLAPENRKKTFPSASVGWVVSKEEWFSKNVPFMSELKPRVSWGTLGNANGIGYYDYLALINNQNNLVLGNETRTSYNYVSTVPSSDLAWETVETFNYGVDFGFFNQRLTGSFDYYTKENKNMLVPFNLPATFGVGTGKVNNGTLETKGWELVVNYRDKIGKDFNYGIGFNLSNSNNVVKSYAGVSTIAAGRNAIIEGYSLNTIWGYATKPGYINNATELAAAPFYSQKTGIGDMAYVDQNGDGKINVGKGTKVDHGDLVMLGKDQQQYLFGVNLNAAYKNVDFSMFVQGVGKRAFQASMDMMQPFKDGWISPSRNQMDYWTPENTGAAFPRPFLQGDQNFNSSDRWTLDGAYARLKNVQLGYSLPQDVLSKMFFTKVRIFVSGENLATISKLGVWDTTFDPEQKNGTYADYPMMRAFALGVNLSF